jgi:hypothetical protein
MTRLTYGISGCCAIVVVAALLFLSPDTQSNERVRELEREANSLRERLQNRVPSVAAIPGAAQEPAQEASSVLPPMMNAEQLAQQVADLSTTVTRLEQTVQNLEDRLSRAIRPLPTGNKTEAGLARKKAELDAQARNSQAATAELQRFAARFGIALDERVVTDSTFPAPLDKQPGFAELRLAATNNLRVLQAVERKFAADLLDRASFQ